MSEAQAPAQVSASSFGALKEEFLLNRYVAASQAENNRNRVLRILFSRIERMSDNMLFKTRELSEIGALDMAAITGVPMPGGNRTSTISIQQAFGLPGGGSQPTLGDRPASNPFKDGFLLLEALGHVQRYFRDEAAARADGRDGDGPGLR
jgi:hypothetical protein